MALLFLLGLIFVAIAVALLVHAVALPRTQMSAHLREIDTYGFNGVTVEGTAHDQAPGHKLRARLEELAESIGRAAGGSGWRAPVEARSLKAAGLYSLTPEAFQGYRVML